MTAGDMDELLKEQSLETVRMIKRLEKTAGSHMADIYAAGVAGGIAEWACRKYGWKEAYNFFQQYADNLILKNPEIWR